MYDLAVAYRIYPRVSAPGRSLPFGDDKLVQSEICLRSFKKSLGDLRVKVWALLDGCPDSYEDMFLRYFSSEDLVIVRLDGIGNLATFGMQIDLLSQQDNSSVVYFAEDDYFYLPNQFPLMIDFLNSGDDVDFISSFDHLDCYKLDLHHFPAWIRVCGEHHWRTAASTCLTFLTSKRTLQACEGVFRSYCKKNHDASLWLSLTKQRVFNPVAIGKYLISDRFLFKMIAKSWFYGWKQILFGRKRALWTPVPSIATHLDDVSLAPAFDWGAKMRTAHGEIVR